MTRVGPYELREPIGRGGMATVFRAYDPVSQQEVALKLLMASGGAHDVRRKRFLREAEALDRLRHPGIVSVLDAGDAKGQLYLAMELVEGESLAERLERGGPLGPREAAHLVARLARAVDHAHSRQLLHRDLKPANVLLEGGRVPRLTDFGLVRDLQPDLAQTQLTADGTQVGTPTYWAPEQAHGELDQLGPTTDVFGLGGLLHATLTGKPPHSGETVLEILASLDLEPQPLPSVDPDLDAVRLRCLRREPSDRYPTAAAVADALEAWLGGKPPLRRSWAWPAVALGGLSVALGYVAATTQSAPAATPAPAVAQASPEEAPPEDPAALIDRASLLMQATEAAQARLLCEQALEIDPNFARAWAALAFLDFQLRDLERADARATRALELDPELAQGYRVVGLLRTVQKRPQQALEAFDRALELDPTDLVALAQRGDLRRHGADLRGALADMNAAIASAPEAPDFYRIRGQIRWELEDLSGAWEDFTTRTQIDPQRMSAWRDLGWVLHDRLELTASRAAFRKLVDLGPQRREGWFSLVFLDLVEGRLGLARDHMDRLEALGTPTGPGLLLQAALETAAGDDQAAEQVYARIAKSYPGLNEVWQTSGSRNSPSLRSALGRIWFCMATKGSRTNALGDAQVWFNRMLILSPDDPFGYVGRGIVKFRRGDKAAARADWLRANTMLPPQHPTREAVDGYLAELDAD